MVLLGSISIGNDVPEYDYEEIAGLRHRMKKSYKKGKKELDDVYFELLRIDAFFNVTELNVLKNFPDYTRKYMDYAMFKSDIINKILKPPTLLTNYKYTQTLR